MLTNNLSLDVLTRCFYTKMDAASQRIDSNATSLLQTPSGVPWWRHQMETFSALLAFVRGIHRSPVNSPQKGQWRRALMFTLICAGINGWVNDRETGDLRRDRAHYDVTVMDPFLCQMVSALCVDVSARSRFLGYW